jgi:hypothetical protein
MHMHDLYSCQKTFSCSLRLTCGLVSTEDDHAVVFAPDHVLLNAAYDAAFQHYHPTALRITVLTHANACNQAMRLTLLVSPAVLLLPECCRCY